MNGQMELPLGQVVEVEFPLVEVPPESWALPPFSGYAKARCPKCASTGEGKIRAEHHAEVAMWQPCGKTINWDQAKFMRIGFPEHLDRRCTSCGYQWVEQIADLANLPEEA